MKNIVYSVVLGLSVAGCGVETGDVTGPKGITASELATHIEILSSDAFGGRAPSSPGEEMTINYLANQFRAMGIAPGNGTSYFQDVPLVDITASPDMTMTVKGGGDDLNLAYGSDMVAWTTRVVEQVSLSDSDLVFVGYGIVAPEYGWNDYEGLDMRGKTAVILVNDPGFATQDAALFKGNTMTYYGRWTYKYEEAARQGAAGAIVIHETAPAAYPWDVVESSWTGPQFNMEAKDGHMGRVKVEAWTSSKASRTLFERAGLDYDAETKAASVRGYKAKSLGQNVSIDIKNTIRHSTSKNVLGMIRGSESPDEYFVYMAHWDHLGIDPTKEGDNIYNGALDNATGTAALLELAEAYASADTPPKRSVVFLAVTAEEQGTLGSAYYAANPVFPLNKTVAGLNMDGLNIIGRTKDITVTGYGLSELDAVLISEAGKKGRRVEPEATPERGYYYRSDHFELAKEGVPMIYPDGGIDHEKHGKEYGLAKAEEYVAKNYHKPSDEYDPSWDLSGAQADVRLFYHVGRSVVDGGKWPNWNEGTEFRAIRDASLQQK